MALVLYSKITFLRTACVTERHFLVLQRCRERVSYPVPARNLLCLHRVRGDEHKTGKPDDFKCLYNCGKCMYHMLHTWGTYCAICFWNKQRLFSERLFFLEKYDVPRYIKWVFIPHTVLKRRKYVCVCVYIYIFKRHLQSFADLWPTLMGFSIYI
jgi:hypothetical protein